MAKFQKTEKNDKVEKVRKVENFPQNPPLAARNFRKKAKFPRGKNF
jgi:hypothetical protein